MDATEWGSDNGADDRVIQVIVASSAEDADFEAAYRISAQTPETIDETDPDATFPVMSRLDVSDAQRVIVRERALDEGDLDDLVDDGDAIFRKYVPDCLGVPILGGAADDDRSWSSVLEEDAGLQVGPRGENEQSDDEILTFDAATVVRVAVCLEC
jgi:hypothetical protein